MSTFLVTGAAGFIGSHLCDRLLADGHAVAGLDNFDPFYPAALKRRNLVGALAHKGFQLHEADIRDSAAMTRIFERMRPSVVVHLAARAGVRPSIEDPRLYADVNVGGTVNMLECARLAGVQKFIFAGSSSVYGNNAKVPFSEEDAVDHPISPYAATKKAGELLAYAYHHLYKLPISCLRFFTVYGPRCRPDLAIAKFTRLIDAGEPVPMFGDGGMKRDFTHISDILQGILASIERCKAFHIYNLGESRPIVLREMIQMIAAALGKPARIQSLPRQPGDVEATFADVARAKKELGYDPEVPFEEGIRDYVQWYLREKPP